MLPNGKRVSIHIPFLMHAVSGNDVDNNNNNGRSDQNVLQFDMTHK